MCPRRANRSTVRWGLTLTACVFAAPWFPQDAFAKNFHRITPEPPPNRALDSNAYSQAWVHTNGSQLRTWNIDGEQVTGVPKGEWYFVVRNQGVFPKGDKESFNREIEDAVRYPGTSGDWGELTGLFVGADRHRFQRGRYDNRHGKSSMVQMKGPAAGSYVNTGTFSHCDKAHAGCMPGGGIQAFYGYLPSGAAIFPWRTISDSRGEGLMAEGLFAVPTSETNGKSVAELSVSIILHDTASKPRKALSILVNIFRSEPMPPGYFTDPGCSHDAVKRHDHNSDAIKDKYFVSTKVAKGTCYATSDYSVSLSKSRPWVNPTLYRVAITRANLLKAIRRINSMAPLPAQPFSSDTSMYELTSVGILQELFPIGGEISSGFSVRTFSMYRF